MSNNTTREAMATNNNDKTLNVPHLRFPEFSGEWKEEQLDSIATLSKGIGISKEQLSEDGEPCILYGELYTKYKSEIIKQVESKTDIDSSKLKRSKANDVIIPYSGETAVDIATARCVPFDNILLGGDLNVISLHKYDGAFMSYQLNGKRKYDIARVAQGVSVVHLYGDHLKAIKTYNPSLPEQQKITELLSLIDERIVTQHKIIEDLKKLKSAIIHRCYSSQTNMIPLSELLKQCSDRNRSGSDLQVLSVSNKYGFIAQSDQFEDREVASDDTSNYKVVKKGMFAYNPARINVGSIALYELDSNGIVSPMYVCFTTKSELLPSYLKYYFASQTFKHEMYKRLEGSVRLCLTFEELCNIEIHLPSIEQQKNISKYISKIENNLSLVDSIFSKYQQQRRYLLSQMFI